MNVARNNLMAAGALASKAAWFQNWSLPAPAERRLMLSNFQEGYMLPGSGWRGFSDRVMGGISNAELSADRLAGRNCIRLAGNVTRECNGGFIQMAMYFGREHEELNGSDYDGIELMVFGNNEEYNLHVRTSDCRWHDQSYRLTFFAKPEWQRLQVPWDALVANRTDAPLNPAKLQRLAVLGWMREFQADVALSEISLYR